MGTFFDIPGVTNEDGSTKSHFVVTGTYSTKAEAKAAIEGLSPAIYSGQYESLSIYEVHPEKNKLYTFTRKDLKDAYAKFQKEQAPPSFFPTGTDGAAQVTVLHDASHPIVLDGKSALPGQALH